jgi:hypothetical protein
MTKGKQHYILGILTAVVFRIITFPISVPREPKIKMYKGIIALHILIFTLTLMDD